MSIQKYTDTRNSGIAAEPSAMLAAASAIRPPDLLFASGAKTKSLTSSSNMALVFAEDASRTVFYTTRAKCAVERADRMAAGKRQGQVRKKRAAHTSTSSAAAFRFSYSLSPRARISAVGKTSASMEEVGKSDLDGTTVGPDKPRQSTRHQETARQTDIQPDSEISSRVRIEPPRHPLQPETR